MERKILGSLLEWKAKKNRLPLIINGARQTGKTYVIREIFSKYFEDHFYVNLESDEIVAGEFSKTIKPKDIVEKLESIFGREAIPEKTLIIFDEIQSCERALTSLKYFCEELPEYHVIAAGSLLGVALNRERSSFPVGKVDLLNMYPMDFEEFLYALNKPILVDKINACYSGNKKMDEMTHALLIDLYKRHLVIGGMPDAIKRYIDTEKLISVVEYHNRILFEYVKDMSKYCTKTEALRNQATYDSLPAQLAKDNRKFQYKLIKKGATAAMYELAIEWLQAAGIVLKCHKVETATHPIQVYTDLAHFKLYMSDTGLLTTKAGLSISVVFGDESNIFKGPLTENYVACALTANGLDLRFWRSKGEAEVDFLIEKGSYVIPVEVKAKDNTTSKSLAEFTNKYTDTPYSIRISTKNFGYVNNIRSVPLYAAFCLSKESI